MSFLPPWRAAILLLLVLTGPIDIVSAQTFHSSPACWKSPRLAHVGAPGAEFANRLAVGLVAPGQPPAAPQLSPNQAYRLWVTGSATADESGTNEATEQTVLVDIGLRSWRNLRVSNAQQPLSPRWISEKLVFLRIAWGRIQFTDLVWDVEKNELVYHELLQDGTLAFQQYQAACAGQCPCNPLWTPAPLPLSRAAPDALIGLLQWPAPTATLPGYLARQDTAAMSQSVALETLQTLEIDYEEPAALVFAQDNDWYQVRPQSHSAQPVWLKAAEPWRYVPLAELLPGRLAYLNAEWSGNVWSSSESTSTWQLSPFKTRSPDALEYPVEILAVRDTPAGMWLQVTFHLTSPCEGGPPQHSPAVWVPAYNEHGRLTVWYWSRGC